MTGNFSELSNDVEVRPISTTWPSIEPACNFYNFSDTFKKHEM